MDFFSQYIKNITEGIHQADFSALLQASNLIEGIPRHNKVIVAGNGGSAAIASHISVDLTKSSGVKSTCFNEAGLITCFGNDYGYEHWIEKAMQAYAEQGDVAILISSSGRSPNIINGAKICSKLGVSLITLSGFDSDNPLRNLGAVNMWIDSREYNIVENTHQVWLSAIVDHIADARKRNKSDV